MTGLASSSRSDIEVIFEIPVAQGSDGVILTLETGL